MILGIIGVAALAWVALFAYPFSTIAHEPYENDVGTDVLPSEDASFEGDERIAVHADGEPALEFERRFAVDGDEFRYAHEWIGEGETTTFARYTDREESLSATRSWIDSAETYERWREDAAENETVRETEDGFVRIDPDDGVQPVDEQFDAFSVMGTGHLLSDLSFEHRGEKTTGERTVEMYEPEGGWYERIVSGYVVEEYRVSDAEGGLHLDAETGALVFAELEYTTVDASNHAEYLAERWDGDDVVTVELVYEVREDADVQRPDWVDEGE